MDLYFIETYERGKGITRCESRFNDWAAFETFDQICSLYEGTKPDYDVSVRVYKDNDENGNHELLKQKDFEGKNVLVSFTKEQFKFLRSELSMLSVAYGVKGGYELEMNETKEKMYDELVDEVFYNATH